MIVADIVVSHCYWVVLCAPCIEGRYLPNRIGLFLHTSAGCLVSRLLFALRNYN